MSLRQPFELRPSVPGRLRDAQDQSPPAAGRPQILASRTAQRQLELPLVFTAAAPRQRLRTG